MTKEQAALQQEEKSRDEKLNVQLKHSSNADQRIHKLLLLGSGESGKTTLFKQIQTIYGDGLSPDDLKSSRGYVYQNVVQALHDLVEHVGDVEGNIAINEENIPALDFYRAVNTDGFEFTPQHYRYAKQLWEDEAILNAWNIREQFHIPESAKFFLDQLDVIADENYCPTPDDFLRIRVRTTGIVQKQFEIDKNKFLLFDVGGQRNERRKWIHCFDGVTAVIFVTAISEYDQLLFEDDKTNRLVESIRLFDEMVNNKYFAATSMLLFLNKSDLFAEKIQTVPLKKYFSRFSGAEGDFDAAKEWILQQFLARNKNPQKMIYFHTTCATSSDNVKTVFTAVKDILIRNSLQDAGLLN
jgi:GTPase SAR1 family protein